MAELVERLGRAGECRVLVVGDVMLDVYVWGDAQRVSPEAPVPVIDVRRTSSSPGGAANAAANVAQLGAVARLVGVVGADENADALRSSLAERGVTDHVLIADPGRPTTTKTRVIAHQQQVARFDSESRARIASDTETAVLAAATERLKGSAVCILSDYGKGAVTPTLASRLIAAARAAGVPVIVDPKDRDFGKYRGATVITPNIHEAEIALGRELVGVAALGEGARALMELTGAAMLVTRGAAGMTLFWDDRSASPGELSVPAAARRVYDVTGAGDTVVASFAVALGCGLSLPEAAHVANAAAGIVVGKIGTDGVTRDELRASHAGSLDGQHGGA